MKLFVDLEKYNSSAIAISDKDEELTVGDIYRLTDNLVSYFEKKCLVFCLCTNSIAALAGYISLMRLGAVLLLLDSDKDKDLLDNLLSIYTPEYMWVEKRLRDKFAKTYVLFEYGDYLLLKTSYSISNINLLDNLSLLLATSGSTGSPKFVRLSNQNVLSNAESIAEYLGITSNERPITSLPMYYSYGLSVINSHLIKGATILLTDKPVIQKSFWEFARNRKATSIAGVPYTYEMLRRLRIFQMNLPYLRTMTQAGGKLNPDISKEYIEQAKTAGKRFIVMYGQTEATARMSYLPEEVALQKFSSIGIAIPHGSFSLIDESGHEILEADKDGELVYTGANVSLGYAECRDDLTKGDENGGVLRTGDIAYRDSDGYYYITGRMKRFVKIFGNRVNLDAIEQLVKTVTTSSACVGVDEKITIFVTEEGKGDVIKSLLMRKTGLNIRAFEVRHINFIPQNGAGKIQYAELSKLLN